MKFGDVVLVNFPDRGGREQRGRRPAIVWQDMEAFSGLPTILIIPLTSRLAALRFPATFRVEASQQNGLTLPSVALVFQLGACDIRRFQEQAGKLSQSDLDQIAGMAGKLQKLK